MKLLQTIHDLAVSQPETLAFISDIKQITYRELLEQIRSNSGIHHGSKPYSSIAYFSVWTHGTGNVDFIPWQCESRSSLYSHRSIG